MSTRIILNQNERARSDDHNRHQIFRQADDAELARQQADTAGGTDDLFPTATQNTTQLSPDSACILGPGLLVTPQLATFNLTISPGVIGMLDPDAVPNPDDSPYKLVRDPGVQTIGALQMIANASGFTRIDVIECARLPGVIVETDSRDVFDPVSGLFTNVSVPKVVSDHLTYRVRQGTPGSGFPGTAAGWVPLAVASVPNGAATNDAITFWDVRPLASDRPIAPYSLGKQAASITCKEMSIDNNAGAHAYLVGVVETSGVFDPTSQTAMPCRLGGVFGISVASGPDLNDAQFQEGGLGNGLAYLYLACPHGLPNWRRYSPPSAGARVPLGVRGLVLLSNTGPGGPVNRSPSAPLALPVPLGFVGQSTSMAICVASAVVSGGNVATMSSDGRHDLQGEGSNGWSQNAASLAGGVATFTMTPNGTRANLGYPASAKSLRVSIELSFTVNASSIASIVPTISGKNAGGSETFFRHRVGSTSWSNATGAPLSWTTVIEVEVPVPTGNGSAAWKLVVDTGVAAGATLSGAVATINGIALN